MSRATRLAATEPPPDPAARPPWPRRPRTSAPVRGTSELLAAVATVAAALRSGAAPTVAWRRGLGVPAHAGVPEWADLAARCPDEPHAVGAVLAAARLAHEIGAPLAPVLDAVVSALARDADAEARRRSALAGPLATARLLAWLPVLGIALGWVLGADPFAVLLDGGGGTALLGAGAAATWVGRRWTARHVRAAVAAGLPR